MVGNAGARWACTAAAGLAMAVALAVTAVTAGAIGTAHASVDETPETPLPALPTPRVDLSPAAADLIAEVRASGDAGGRPWAVVDKAGARLLVFAADGRLVGETPVLLGLARGDESAPDVGRRAQAGRVPREQRTTPAGRFPSEPGRNLSGEAVVWVDYDSAFAIHRLRPAPAAERRPQRLASPTPADNRISLGCVVVDPGFFDRVVMPMLGRGRSVVYVLPETRDWRTLFGESMAARARRASGG